MGSRCTKAMPGEQNIIWRWPEPQNGWGWRAPRAGCPSLPEKSNWQRREGRLQSQDIWNHLERSNIWPKQGWQFSRLLAWKEKSTPPINAPFSGLCSFEDIKGTIQGISKSWRQPFYRGLMVETLSPLYRTHPEAPSKPRRSLPPLRRSPSCRINHHLLLSCNKNHHVQAFKQYLLLQTHYDSAVAINTSASNTRVRSICEAAVQNCKL